MSAMTPRDVTVLLERSREGDEAARDELFQVAFADLRRFASKLMAGERTDHTLQPTALVSEAYLRLVNYDPSFARNRKEFFALCATVMRHVLADYARSRGRAKRGGEFERVDFERALAAWDPRTTNEQGYSLFDVAEMLFDFERQYGKRPAQALDLKVFGGMTYPEIGECLGISANTAYKDVKAAEAWIKKELTRLGRGPR